MYRIIVIPFLYICVAIMLPIVSILFTPLIIYRRIVSQVIRLVGGRSIGQILTSVGTSHACISRKESNIFPFVVEGVPDLDRIKAKFIENILNAKDPAGGLLYPELRQTIVSRGGYLFWADIPNFTLPIRFLNVSPIHIDSEEGIQFLRALFSRKWKYGEEALWELLIVPGLEGKFCIVFVNHHALCDAFSVQKLLNKVSNPPIVGKSVHLGNPRCKVVSLIKTLFLIPYDLSLFLEAFLRTRLFRRDIKTANFMEVVTAIEKPTPGMTICTTSLNLAELKNISESSAVSLSAVLLSAIQASIQKCDGKNGLLYFPLPTPIHPQKLDNVTWMGYIELSQNGTIHEILNRIDEQFKKLKDSTFPRLTKTSAGLCGNLPSFLLKKIVHGVLTEGNLRTYVASMFIMYRHPFRLFGYPVVKLGSVGSGLEGTNAVTFFLFSSNDSVRVSLMGDGKIVTKLEGDALLEGMMEELKICRKSLDMNHHVEITCNGHHDK